MSREELHDLITDASGMSLPRTTLVVERKVVEPLQSEIDRLTAEGETWKQKYHKEAEKGDIAFTESMTYVIEIAERDKTIKELKDDIAFLEKQLIEQSERYGFTFTPVTKPQP